MSIFSSYKVKIFLNSGKAKVKSDLRTISHPWPPGSPPWLTFIHLFQFQHWIYGPETTFRCLTS